MIMLPIYLKLYQSTSIFFQIALLAPPYLGDPVIRDQRLRDHDHRPDSELQKWATFCNSRSQEKLCRKTTQFLVIATCRNRLLSAIHDLKKNYTISQEKLYNFS